MSKLLSHLKIKLITLGRKQTFYPSEVTMLRGWFLPNKTILELFKHLIVKVYCYKKKSFKLTIKHIFNKIFGIVLMCEMHKCYCTVFMSHLYVNIFT